MKARSLAVLFFITVAVVISGCSLIGRGGTQSTGAQAHKEISIDDFRARLQANPKAKVVDVRSEAEYKDWHI